MPARYSYFALPIRRVAFYQILVSRLREHDPTRLVVDSARLFFFSFSFRADWDDNRSRRYRISGEIIIFAVSEGMRYVRERRGSRSSWFSSWSRVGASGSACGACSDDAWSLDPGYAVDSAWSGPECRPGARPRDGPDRTRSRWICSRSCSPDGDRLSAGIKGSNVRAIEIFTDFSTYSSLPAPTPSPRYIAFYFCKILSPRFVKYCFFPRRLFRRSNTIIKLHKSGYTYIKNLDYIKWNATVIRSKRKDIFFFNEMTFLIKMSCRYIDSTCFENAWRKISLKDSNVDRNYTSIPHYYRTVSGIISVIWNKEDMYFFIAIVVFAEFLFTTIWENTFWSKAAHFFWQ